MIFFFVITFSMNKHEYALLTSFLDRRLARRGGVGRISGQIYEDARTAMVYQLKRVSRELTRGFGSFGSQLNDVNSML
jgi:hypothetical protein